MSLDRVRFGKVIVIGFILLAVLILVTYVPVTGMGLVDFFYH
jgi:hypothetical protein